jgi:hypothetical protein
MIIKGVTAGRIRGEGSSGELQLGGYTGKIIRRVTARKIRGEVKQGITRNARLGGHLGKQQYVRTGKLHTKVKTGV